MLFTDALPISIADISPIDPEIVEVAFAARYDTAAIFAQACDEGAQLLLSRLQSSGSGYGQSGDLSWNHLFGVLGSSSRGNFPRAQLGQIVITNPRPGYTGAVKLFLAYTCLMSFYRAALGRSGDNGDRFETKRVSFRKEIDRVYWPMLRAQGLPIVWTPLPCPGAIYEPNTGTWAATATGSGSTAAAGSYDVAITWTGIDYISPIRRQNSESHPSAIQSVTLTLAQLIHLDISGLNPPVTSPANPVPAGYSGYAPAMPATGWNVYANVTGQALKLINATPIPVTTKTYNADPGARLAITVGTGQFPTQQLTFTSTIGRG